MYRKIKNSLDIKRVMQDHNINFDAHNKCKCFIHKDKDPSISIKKNRYHCFGCGADGDVIDFIVCILNVNYQTAALYLDNRYCLNADEKIIKEFDQIRIDIMTLTKKLKIIEEKGKQEALYNKYADVFCVLLLDIDKTRTEYKNILYKLNQVKGKLINAKFYNDISSFYDQIISSDNKEYYRD